MPVNYDKIATVYDRLSRLVYGKSLIKAQLFLLKAIPPESNILIAGGGTGWILEELAKLHGTGLVITYVESSAKMLALAQKRSYGENTVAFMHVPVEEATLHAQYDVVLTPFLFDNFQQHKAGMIFNKLNTLLKSGGLWLYADFQVKSGSLWQASTLYTMYLFFRLFCKIETNKLPDMERYFKLPYYRKVGEAGFYRQFILSRVYRKDTHITI